MWRQAGVDQYALDSDNALLPAKTPHNLVLQWIVVKMQPLNKPRTYDQNWFN